MGIIWQDLRYDVRLLIKNPNFTRNPDYLKAVRALSILLGAGVFGGGAIALGWQPGQEHKPVARQQADGGKPVSDAAAPAKRAFERLKKLEGGWIAAAQKAGRKRSPSRQLRKARSYTKALSMHIRTRLWPQCTTWMATGYC